MGQNLSAKYCIELGEKSVRSERFRVSPVQLWSYQLPWLWDSRWSANSRSLGVLDAKTLSKAVSELGESGTRLVENREAPDSVSFSWGWRSCRKRRKRFRVHALNSANVSKKKNCERRRLKKLYKTSKTALPHCLLKLAGAASQAFTTENQAKDQPRTHLSSHPERVSLQRHSILIRERSCLAQA